MPSVEAFERRLLLAVYTVTTTVDGAPGGMPVPGSLRQAILSVDGDSTPDVIDFNIGGGGPATIALTSPLPAITNTATIDGTSQHGYAGTPLITIDATRATGFSANGLDIQAPGTVVQGLAVVGAGSAGILIEQGADRSVVRADYLGVNPQTMLAQPNAVFGLSVMASACTIGGTSAADADVISGNQGGGITIQGPDNVVIGDRIGTGPGAIDSFGSAFAPLPNSGPGIQLVGASGNVIGEPGAGNLIAANAAQGIVLKFLASGNLIQANAIGTTLATGGGIGLGPGNLGNGGDGIGLISSSSNTIGGTAAGAGNVISGNAGDGVNISGGSGNVISADLIGIGADGSTARANGGDGVFVGNSAANTVGGTAAGSGDVISGNSGDGVTLSGPSSTRNLVEGDIIGVARAQNFVVPNVGQGVDILGAPANLVLFDIISGNDQNGVLIEGAGARGNVVQGSFIGTDSLGDNNKLSNLLDGIRVLNAPGNLIGGAGAGLGNVASFNFGNGISLRGPSASGNVLQANIVGLSADGTQIAQNLLNGVFIENAPSNVIGGVNALNPDGTIRTLVGNVVSANNESGILSQYNANAPEGVGFPDSNLFQGNLIGTDLTGTQGGYGNLLEGIDVFSGQHNTIGGTVPGSGNVISGNDTFGILILGPDTPASQGGSTRAAAANLIEGNLIGSDLTGRYQIGNLEQGVEIANAVANTVGGPTAGARNLISGNQGSGVLINGNFTDPGTGVTTVATLNVVMGNYIGTDITGTTRLIDTSGSTGNLGNFQDGVVINSGASGNFIGGPGPGEGNLISGNGLSGVHIAQGADDNLVQGNLIGTNVAGLKALGNTLDGVRVENASGNTIGGTVAGSGNVVDGNSIGVEITGSGANNNLVQGNMVGLGVDGSTSVGNLGFGVALDGGVVGNTIGGTTAPARNVISSNGQGLEIVGPGSTGNVVEGDYIGLDATGSQPRGNLQLGVFLNAAAGNTIGGTAAGAGDVISANSGVGLEIFGPSASGNLVAGNLIGLDATGSKTGTLAGLVLGNSSFGIEVEDAPNNTIGGITPAARNVVSGNRQAGIDVSDASASGTVIEGNYIGTDLAGTAGLGNLADGVLISNAPGAVIGGAVAAARNLISANLASGIEIAGVGSIFDEVLGNDIGTDATGSAALGNLQSGVFINGAPGVTIGGTIASLGNLISANAQDGVRIFGVASARTVVLGNFIGTNAGGSAALGNGNDGVLFDSTAGVTVGGTAPGSSNVISGNLSSGVEFGGTGTFFDVLEGNLIGTNRAGSAAIPNATGVFVNDSPFDQIGGTAPFSGNLISGNVGPGVHIFGVGALEVAVLGNRIGTDLAGLAPIANLAGVFIDSAPKNVVIGDLISGNTSAGVVIEGTDSVLNLIQGDLIGTDVTGSRAIGSASPQQSGVLLDDSPDNIIGGTTLGTRDVISGNVAGVVITGFNATGNLVLGSLIGTDSTGRVAVPNATGVYINGSSANAIGGPEAGAGDLISGNTAAGLNLFGPQTTGNLIEGNFIGTDASGAASLANYSGVFIDAAPTNSVVGNLISANSVAGVYVFDGASGNLVERNRIGVGSGGQKLGNAQYGVLLYNAASNTVPMSGPTANVLANSGIGNFREFTGAVPTSSTSTTTTTTTTTKKKPKTVAKSSVPAGPLASASISRPGSAGGSASTRRTGR